MNILSAKSIIGISRKFPRSRFPHILSDKTKVLLSDGLIVHGALIVMNKIMGIVKI